jgi:hypothetical protein
MRSVFYPNRVSADSILWGILADGELVVVPTEEIAEEMRAMVRQKGRRCLKDLLEADPTIDVDHARNQSIEVRTRAEHRALRFNEKQASRHPTQAVCGAETGLVDVVEPDEPVGERPVEEAQAEQERLAEERRRKEIADLEPENGVFAWTPKYDFHTIVRQFPPEGKFEDNTYRPSAREMMEGMISWTAKIDSGQLVIERHMGGNATAVVYTGIRVGEIAGGTGSDSIRVVRRDEGEDGRKFYFQNSHPWVSREVPKECDTPWKAVRHHVKKINKQVAAWTRECPECAEEGVENVQVKCKRGKGRDASTWWKGLECRHSTR